MRSRTFFLICLSLTVSCVSFTRSRLFGISKNIDIPIIKQEKDRLITIQNGSRVVRGLLTLNSSRLCILFHASRTTIKGDEINARTLFENGYSTLMPEYPGYGISSCYKVAEQDIYSDVSALITYVLEMYNFKNDSIVLFGSSLGTGIAFEMAKRGFGSKLAVIASFTNTFDIVHKYIPVDCMVRRIVKDKFDNLGKAKSLSIPVLLIHGADDKLFPLSMPKRLNKSLVNSQLRVIPGITHENIWKFIETTMMDTIVQFFNKDNKPSE